METIAQESPGTSVLPARITCLSWKILNKVEQDEPLAINFNPRHFRWRARHGLWRPRCGGGHATSTSLVKWLSCYTVAVAVAVAAAAAVVVVVVVVVVVAEQSYE